MFLTAVFCVVLPLTIAMDDTLPKGSLRFKTVFTTYDGDQFLDKDKVSLPLSALTDHEEYNEDRLDLHFEFGWGRDLTMVAKTSFRSRELSGGADSIKTSGVDGLYLGLRQRLNGRNDSTRFMAETAVWVPIEADQNEALPLEYEAVNWIAIVSYNQDFFPTPGGFEMDFGYRFRNEDPDDEYFFDTALNLKIMALADMKIHYHVIESRKTRGVDYSPLSYATDRGDQSVGIDFSRDFGARWQVGIGYQSHFKGRNIMERDGFRLSVTWRR